MAAPVGIGDLAQIFRLAGRNAALGGRATTLSRELITGEAADPARRLGGDTAPLAAIEHGRARLEAYRLTSAEATTRAAAMQRVLATVSTTAGESADTLLSAATAGSGTMTTAAGAGARGAFLDVSAALNTETAGRTLFAGTATDRPALADGEAMLAAIEAAAAGAGTAADVMAAVEAWFRTPGGGFESTGYRGGTGAGPVQLAATTRVALDLTAADPAPRRALEALAMGALLADPTLLGGDAGARADLARAAGERLKAAGGGLAAARGALGVTEQRIGAAQAANAAEADALTRARDRLIGVDPFRTASELEAVQSQIEMLQTLTVRMSRLDLVRFLG